MQRSRAFYTPIGNVLVPSQQRRRTTSPLLTFQLTALSVSREIRSPQLHNTLVYLPPWRKKNRELTLACSNPDTYLLPYPGPSTPLPSPFPPLLRTDKPALVACQHTRCRVADCMSRVASQLLVCNSNVSGTLSAILDRLLCKLCTLCMHCVLRSFRFVLWPEFASGVFGLRIVGLRARGGFRVRVLVRVL